MWCRTRRPSSLFLAALFLLAAEGVSVARADDTLPAMPAPAPQFDVAPDYAGIAANFLAAIGKSSPRALEDHLDQRTADEIGRKVAAGDYDGASHAAMRQLGEKLIGEIPVVGQMYAMGQLGSALGDWAIKYFGDARYASTYQKLEERLGGEWANERPDEFARVTLDRAMNGPLRGFLEQNIGGKRTDAEWVQILWQLMKGKHDFEMLCDHFGLQGADRTYDKLQAVYDKATRTAMKTAQMLEEDRVATQKVRLAKEAAARAEQARKDAEDAARKKREMEERRVALCAAWFGTGTTDLPYYTPPPEDDYVKELCGKAPPKPPVVADAPPADDQPAVDATDAPQADDFSPDHAELAGIKWAIEARADDDRTVFTLNVTETYQSAAFDIHVFAEPVGDYRSGGVIAGADRVNLIKGASHAFTIIATGEVRAVEITLWSMDSVASRITRPTVHDSNAKNDGVFSGQFTGAANGGEIRLSVAGSSVTGSIGGSFAAQGQRGTISAAVMGTLDPRTGVLAASWSGAISGQYLDEDGKENGTFNEPLDGSVTGILAGDTLSGQWRGGNDYFEDLGEWSASR